MYIRKTTSKHRGKIYTNYLLVESVATPKGPRQKTICSLGDLGPRPREEWLKLARKMENALTGQLSLFQEQSEPEFDILVEKARERRKGIEPPSQPPKLPPGEPPSWGTLPAALPPQGSKKCMIEVDTEGVETERHREAGPVHVGIQICRRLGIEEILESVGLSDNARQLTIAMILNRFICPSSEHAMPGWFERTALSDILGFDFSKVNDDRLYRNMDRLYPLRHKIESALTECENTLFNLENTILLYDLTSTYFEGLMLGNPQAKHGYSRDKRPDCKQVLVGLVLGQEGFPKAHEVFDGNLQDRKTVGKMLDILKARVGVKEGSTVVVDRGMAYEENLAEINARHLHYIVAGRQTERYQWLAEFEEEGGWQEIFRTPSPTNPAQEKTRVFVKAVENDGHTYALCLSEGRKQKDRAIREKQECRLLVDLEKLQKRVEKGNAKKPSVIHEAIGRLKERYPRVARYYSIEYDSEQRHFSWAVKADARTRAEELDGGYILKTDRQDLTGEELWRIYIMLTRVEAAFRDMKSPLCERPIFHQIKNRTQTHVFLCVLAYHLLVSVEHMLRDQNDHRSWETIREILKTHQVATIILPTTSGEELHIRKGGRAESQHREIYRNLRIPEKLMKPIRTWHPARGSLNSDEFLAENTI